MLYVEQFRNRQTGEALAGLIVRNRQGKALAIGAAGSFVQMTCRRYSNDSDLVRKVEQLTGLAARL